MSFLVSTKGIEHPERTITLNSVLKGDLVVAAISLNGASTDPIMQGGFTKIGNQTKNGNYLYYKWIDADSSSFNVTSGYYGSLFTMYAFLYRGLEKIEMAAEVAIPASSPYTYTHTFADIKSGIVVSAASSKNVNSQEFTDVNSVTHTLSGWTWPVVPLIVATATSPVQKRLLVQDGNNIKFYNVGWKIAGTVPVTDTMFTTNGMNDFSDIPDAQWKGISPDSKILVYTETDRVFTADVTMHNLYEPVSKSYHGPGIIETEMEDLPVHPKFLIVNADQEECTFKYSLDDGSTWTPLIIGDVIDVSSKTGTQLKIQTTMSTETAKLTAISYAWA